MYSKAYRAMVIQKATGPNALSFEELTKEFDASRASIYRWLKEAATEETRPAAVIDEPRHLPKPSKMKRPQDWSPEEKLAAVLEAASLSDAELGAFLRNKGLHETHLQQWREQMLDGLKPVPTQNKNIASESERIRKLQKDLRLKEKALAETAALLVLKKKAQEIWGDGGDDTGS